MKKVIRCCKVDWNKTGRKTNEIELTLRLERRHNAKNGAWCFSCCGSVWNARRTDLIAGGQCLDEIFKFKEMEHWREIYDFWLRYHLNDMTAGSPRQETAVKAWNKRREKNGKTYDFSEACNMLKRKGLYEDKEFIYKGKPYKYGSAWLVTKIPSKDVKKIKKWIES